MEPIIKVENIGKQYRLGNVGTGTLSHDITRWWQTSIRGKEDPYLKIGEANDRTQKGGSDYVWALQDINFEVQPGEILGIIGKNGAGKSTLLKLLSRVTAPTNGKITCHGRIASLLEVGTGFHPELTGRENIYLNGAILGMSKKEIADKFDEIVDFAGCAKYVDTPVKRYSSGMHVRLGFAVAAHLEPDILVVDEVLAVGDAEFQKKAIGKMQEVSQGKGRTVLFVSHNMASVKSLCSRAVVLEYGKVVFEGVTDKAVDYYLQSGEKTTSSIYINKEPLKESDIIEVSVNDKSGKTSAVFGFDELIILKIKFRVEPRLKEKAVIGFKLIDRKECVIFSSMKKVEGISSIGEDKEALIELPKSVLAPNKYKINIGYHIPNQVKIKVLVNAVSFTIEETGSDFYQYHGNNYGCVILPCNWI